MLDPGGPAQDVWVTADGARLYYTRVWMAAGGGAETRALLVRDTRSGAERELLKGRQLWTRASRDGRLIAAMVSNSSLEAADTLVVVSTDDDSVREVMRAGAGESLGFTAWAPDGSSVLVQTSASEDRFDSSKLWWVPLDGRPRAQIQGMEGPLTVDVHPSGQQLAFTVRKPTTPAEVWTIRNLLAERRIVR